jgi:thioredoxin reductase (NADPH)
MSVRDVLIIGGGPSGLSAAIACKKRDLDYVVVEQGVLVNSIYRFPPHMVFFTTPELLEIGGLPLTSPYDKPTRTEALNYYRRVADTYDLQICCDEKVLAIEREAGAAETAGQAGDELFAVETRSSRGVRRARLARTVILAIGYYDHPVTIGVPGEDLPHVSHFYREAHLHYRQRVVVVGGGNSAAEAALELYRAGAHVTLVHRSPTLKPTIKYWVRPDIENRIKEGSINGQFSAAVREIRPTSVVIAPCHGADSALPPEVPMPADSSAGYAAPQRSGPTSVEEIPADFVYLLTGYRADTDLMVRAGVALTSRQAPVHNPGTFETNVAGLFVAGGAIAGVDTGTIFIENGRFHGEKIVDVIARRLEHQSA